MLLLESRDRGAGFILLLESGDRASGFMLLLESGDQTAGFILLLESGDRTAGFMLLLFILVLEREWRPGCRFHQLLLFCIIDWVQPKTEYGRTDGRTNLTFYIKF